MISPVPNIYHWRTHGGAEVDLLFEVDDVFYPVEIKCKSHPSKADLSGIQAFRETYPKLNIAPALVIAACERQTPLGSHAFAIPFDLV